MRRFFQNSVNFQKTPLISKVPGLHAKKAHSCYIFKLRGIMLTLSLFIFFVLESNSKYTIFLQEAARRFLGFGFWKALKESFVSAT